MDDNTIAGPFNQLTIACTSTAFQISLAALGGATHKTLQFGVNGFYSLILGDSGAQIVNPTTTGAVPTVTAGSGACGTSPTIVGNNNVFRITVGSSTNGGNCPVVFSSAFAHAPVCVPVNETSGARGAYPASPTTSGVTITADSTFTAGDSIGVTCAGYN
jgi:hypothetical protein